MTAVLHRHGRRTHAHAYARPHRHVLAPHASGEVLASDHAHHHHEQHHDHRHSHALVDRSLIRTREGVKAVGQSLAVLAVAALVQLVIFLLSNSVALLADLIHNFGDALTALPLGI